MSETAPTPSSFPDSIRRAAAVSRAVASVLVILVSGRFAIASVRQAISVSAANFEDKPAPHPSAEPAELGSVSLPTAFPTPPRPSAKAGSSGRSLSIALVVAYGAPRSEVYVNGRLVGKTPFVGDTSCKSGLPLRIEIVPAEGAPLTYLRECRGATLEITAAPP